MLRRHLNRVLSGGGRVNGYHECHDASRGAQRDRDQPGVVSSIGIYLLKTTRFSETFVCKTVNVTLRATLLAFDTPLERLLEGFVLLRSK